MGLNSREVIDKVLRSGGGRELDTGNRDYNCLLWEGPD